MSTIHVPAGAGRRYHMIDGDHIAKAAVHDTNGAFEVFEVIAPAAPMAPPHVSPWTGVLYLLQGRITALVSVTPPTPWTPAQSWLPLGDPEHLPGRR